MSQKPQADFLHYYNQYKDKIYTFFWYRVNFNQALAEDLTSEVFIKALKNFNSFDQEKPFQAWIYKIAQNHLINHYKISNRETELIEAENIGRAFSKQIEAKIEIDKAIAAIELMGEYHKQVLLLRFVDGLSNNEIAILLNKEEGSIRTQMSRALDELRKSLINPHE
jgi:RNA polymerase sigma-70 factor, ECF subfamily